jgi:crotonobetainyl-CoA:carnitine CoA-transferase CaiB-like acyl-CoA transferase
MTDEDLPLDGIKVLELAQMVAGPSAGLLLADYGADVIKVEPPQGDGGRQLRSLAAANLPDSPVFVGYNRDKRLIRLDLRSAEGHAKVLELVDEADVLIESSRPGVMERLGLSADELLARNPRLVYASVSGFGRGPIGSRKGGVDIVVQAESGIISTTGYPDRPPTKVGFTVVDAACGHALCHGILAALFRRERTGRGDVIRLSLYDVALHLQTGPLTEYLMTGQQTPRAGNSAPLTAPADLLRCADGDIIVSAYLDPHWRAFTAAIGAPELVEDPRFGSGVDRARHRGELVELIEKRLAGGTVAEWVERLQDVGVLVAEVKDHAAVAADPLAAESGLLRQVGDAHGVASPLRFERTVAHEPQPRQELETPEIRFGAR